MLDDRNYGILLPIFSLPSPYGIGDLGRNAYKFADFLARAGAGIWQILPLNETSDVMDNSPYSSNSAFAANPLLIGPGRLKQDGLLSEEDLSNVPNFDPNEVEYKRVTEYKYKLLEIAYNNYLKRDDITDFDNICRENAFWLDDYALYIALKDKFDQKPWYDWPEPYRDRNPETLAKARIELTGQIERQKIFQFFFLTEWTALKSYCNERNIKIFGDIPIYVNSDSSDTWSNQSLFKLGRDKRPAKLAGVPPDYFSKTGQLWGNPVYNWEKLQETGYHWWIKRLRHMFTLYDVLRIDHFRGLVAYWEVPAGAKTAEKGTWVPVPHEDFFGAIRKAFDGAPIVAEDLGTITKNVIEVRDKYRFPGMKILQFAFGADDPDHGYLPHNYKENFIVYTGTHDNNTVRGWFDTEASPEDKKRLERYTGQTVDSSNVHTVLIREALASVAKWAVLPLQDVLGLGKEARINLPASGNGNWKWRAPEKMITDQVAENLYRMAYTYGRTAKS